LEITALLRHTTLFYEEEKMPTFQKEVQTKLAKGLLDLIVLEFLDAKPMHGYQIITKVRKNFGVYFGPSTVYPLLASLEEKGHVESRWNTESGKPRKVYELTTHGKNVLDLTENTLALICHKISKNNAVEISAMDNGNNLVGFEKRTSLVHASLNK